MIALAHDPIDPAALFADFTREANGVGAVVSFSGIVRPDDGVTELWLDHHERLTLQAIEDVAATARERFGLVDLAIVHRVGSVEPGEPIVFVAAAAAHRRAAFEGVDFVMDRLKTGVPLWKKEVRENDEKWVEARGQDHDDAARWERQVIEKAFVPVRLAILTVSDTRTGETDSSGGFLANAVEEAGHILADRAIVPDGIANIRAAAEPWIARDDVDVIISTGGTGLTGRDVTPEAFAPLFDKQIDGFSAMFHRVSFDSIGLSTIQSRACAGVANGTFIFCLPGSGGAVRDGWGKIIVHQLDARTRPCNLVEIMPRLSEK